MSKALFKRKRKVEYAAHTTAALTRVTKDEGELLLRIIEETLAGLED